MFFEQIKDVRFRRLRRSLRKAEAFFTWVIRSGQLRHMKKAVRRLNKVVNTALRVKALNSPLNTIVRTGGEHY